MIFVTVGTHEQQFDRLIRQIDLLKESNLIKEDVFIQTGYSDYKPRFCEYKDMIGYEEMDSYVKKANIVITHGGPGSIMLPFKYGKVPIVVPRQVDFEEHVDNHQKIFAEFLENRNKIIAVYDIENLYEYISNYDKYSKNNSTEYECINNTKDFVNKFEKLINDII